MRDLAQRSKPHVWVNVHSGMEALFMPFDHQAAVPAGPKAAAALQLLEQLNKAACGSRCAVGSGGKSVGKHPAWRLGHHAGLMAVLQSHNKVLPSVGHSICAAAGAFQQGCLPELMCCRLWRRVCG